MTPTSGLLSSAIGWLEGEKSIKSAVLFGSSCRLLGDKASADEWSDIDLHIGSSNTRRLENMNWARVFPDKKYCLQIVRPATGGVRKATVLFASGQLDLILVPIEQLYLAGFAMQLGLHRRKGKLQTALNEVKTCLRSGYKFIKGEARWAPLYSRIADEMAGIRLENREACRLAEAFLCDMLWVLQKIQRGELAAAQRMVHHSLAETNFRFLRELRLRRGDPLPSFGLARRVETLLPLHELAWITVDSRLDRVELDRVAWSLHSGMKALMAHLAPEWHSTKEMSELLSSYAIR